MWSWGGLLRTATVAASVAATAAAAATTEPIATQTAAAIASPPPTPSAAEDYGGATGGLPSRARGEKARREETQAAAAAAARASAWYGGASGPSRAGRHTGGTTRWPPGRNATQRPGGRPDAAVAHVLACSLGGVGRCQPGAVCDLLRRESRWRGAHRWHRAGTPRGRHGPDANRRGFGGAIPAHPDGARG